MIAYAAIDLKGGRVVQLIGGRIENEVVSWPDPIAVAQRWIDEGFAALHVVDLDAALGSGNNEAIIQKIVAQSSVPVHVGGGIREAARAAEWLDAGAARVIVGTRAVEDPDWRRQLAGIHPGRVVVAADVRDGCIVTRGWQHATSQTAQEFLKTLEHDQLGGVLVTDVGREGQMLGADSQMFGALVRTSAHPLIAAGGIRGVEDLRALAAVGVAGAVLGMALYRGAIDPAVVTLEYAA